MVVNVDYTIAPDAIYPEPIRQVGQALAFLDREGKRLGINRDAFVIAGDSAGAQLAAQTANIITSPDYASAVGIAAPIRAGQLRGALLYCGVYDVAQLGDGWFIRTVTWAYSGKRDWRSVAGFERVSVARYVTKAFPPRSSARAMPIRWGRNRTSWPKRCATPACRSRRCSTPPAMRPSWPMNTSSISTRSTDAGPGRVACLVGPAVPSPLTLARHAGVARRCLWRGRAPREGKFETAAAVPHTDPPAASGGRGAGEMKLV